MRFDFLLDNDEVLYFLVRFYHDSAAIYTWEYIIIIIIIIMHLVHQYRYSRVIPLKDRCWVPIKHLSWSEVNAFNHCLIGIL